MWKSLKREDLRARLKDNIGRHICIVYVDGSGARIGKITTNIEAEYYSKLGRQIYTIDDLQNSPFYMWALMPKHFDSVMGLAIEENPAHIEQYNLNLFRK